MRFRPWIFLILALCVQCAYPCPLDKLVQLRPDLPPHFEYWDNWIYFDSEKKEFHLYVQSYPKHEGVTDQERKLGVQIRKFSSKDGIHWSGGEAVPAREGMRNWSGNRLEDWLYWTEVTESLEQKIVGARENDYEGTFQVILEPQATLDYDISAEDGNVPAFRDPFPFKQGEETHLFFAAKKAGAPSKPAVGHAVKTPQGFRLEEPFTLPGSMTQIELPNIVRVGNRYLLLVSTTNRVSESQDISEINPALRAYWSDSMKGPWKPHDGGEGIVETPEHTYGYNLVRNLPTEELLISGFQSPPNPDSFRIAPVLKLEVHGDRVEVRALKP